MARVRGAYGHPLTRVRATELVIVCTALLTLFLHGNATVALIVGAMRHQRALVDGSEAGYLGVGDLKSWLQVAISTGSRPMFPSQPLAVERRR